MIKTCQKCKASAIDTVIHKPDCEMPDVIQLLANLDDIARSMRKELLEHYGLDKPIKKMYEILNRRAGIKW